MPPELGIGPPDISVACDQVMPDKRWRGQCVTVVIEVPINVG